MKTKRLQTLFVPLVATQTMFVVVDEVPKLNLGSFVRGTIKITI
jgi:hypothetical protein